MRSIIAFGVLMLIAAIQAQDLQCYVCNDCETGYEKFNKTCSGSENGDGDGSGSGEGDGSGSGDGDGSGSGDNSGGGSETDDGLDGGDFDVIGTSNDESNLISSNRIENTDHYSVQMTDTDKEKTVSGKTLIRFARSTRNNDNLEPRCVVTSYEENSTTKIKRGCSYDSGDDTQKCKRLIGVNYTGTLARCSVCNENLCNTAHNSFGSFHLQFAFITLLIGVFMNA